VIEHCDVIEWFKNYKPLVGIYQYHINHDMGKPYCIVYGEDGKAHYPNHSQISYELYVSKFGQNVYADLIKNDMIFHSGSMEEIKSYCKNPIAIHSYATAWAEIFSNAELFGGIESTSFKIKKKKLIRSLKYLKYKEDNT
jgi:hypothetical protein